MSIVTTCVISLGVSHTNALKQSIDQRLTENPSSCWQKCDSLRLDPARWNRLVARRRSRADEGDNDSDHSDDEYASDDDDDDDTDASATAADVVVNFRHAMQYVHANDYLLATLSPSALHILDSVAERFPTIERNSGEKCEPIVASFTLRSTLTPAVCFPARAHQRAFGGDRVQIPSSSSGRGGRPRSIRVQLCPSLVNRARYRAAKTSRAAVKSFFSRINNG